MTSEVNINDDWTCGWSCILNELGRAALLEYPIFSVSAERASRAPVPTPPSTATSTSPPGGAYSMPVPRISIPRPAALRARVPRATPTPSRPYSASCPLLSGWSGVSRDDHAVNRTDEKDTQSKPSHQGMREKEGGDSMSIGISERGGEANKQAQKDKPEAPKPVIGMNDQVGGKGH